MNRYKFAKINGAIMPETNYYLISGDLSDDFVVNVLQDGLVICQLGLTKFNLNHNCFNSEVSNGGLYVNQFKILNGETFTTFSNDLMNFLKVKYLYTKKDITGFVPWLEDYKYFCVDKNFESYLIGVKKYFAFSNSCFVYKGFDKEYIDDILQVVYDFEIAGLSQFNPSLTFKIRKDIVLNDQLVDNFLFHIGLIESISYYKVCCCKKYVFKHNYLNNQQLEFFRKLMYFGLGEYFYVNGLRLNINEFVTFRVEGDIKYEVIDDYQVYGNLIPVGGGKDSFVTLDILKGEYDNNKAFVFNKVKSALSSCQASGYSGDKLLEVGRTMDKRMLELNLQGYLNGHTPFSSLLAFVSCFVAYLNGLENIVLSNENSANESTIKDEKINHQYSKTYEFELDFNQYLSNYVTHRLNYFSLLRRFNELQISAIFATLKPYHLVFRSCNVGSKVEQWCNNCAKCTFVAIMLSAFLLDNELKEIFNEDILNKEDLLVYVNQLVGISPNKPFECVGTRSEVLAAIKMAINLRIKNNKNIPFLLSNKAFMAISEEQINDVLYEYNDEHFINDHFISLVNDRLKEVLDELN
ncbi:MAG: hypothetical protein WBO70_05035 [Erysipelotrichaceae bacterium]